jgi:DNA-binding GntR family transcriptional regulator
VGNPIGADNFDIGAPLATVAEMASGSTEGARLAVVHQLDGPTRAEAVAEDVRAAIHRGELLPGQLIPLRELSEQGGCRQATLRLALESVERDRLLTIRGAVAVVAPLDPDDLNSAFNLLIPMGTELSARVHRQISPARLRRVKAMIPVNSDRGDYDTDVVAPGFQQTRRLVGPVLTGAERCALTLIGDTIRRYLNLAAAADPAYARLRAQARYDVEQDLMERYRSRNVHAVQEATRRSHLNLERFAQLSLDSYRGTDHPIARVISLRKPRTPFRGGPDTVSSGTDQFR